MRVSLKAARVNRNLSQKKVANSMGVSQSTVVKWEEKDGLKRIPFARLHSLLALYDMSIDDLDCDFFMPEDITESNNERD